MLSNFKRALTLVTGSALAVTGLIHATVAPEPSTSPSSKNKLTEQTHIDSTLEEILAENDFDGSHARFKSTQMLNRNYAALCGEFFQGLIMAGVPREVACAMVMERFTQMAGTSELEPGITEFEDIDWDED